MTEDSRKRPAQTPPPAEGTIVQPSEALLESKELSAPKGVEQHPEAPNIPGYILIQPLGKGAFAAVWRAWQIRTRKPLAVKVFHQQHGVNWLYLQREVERLIRLDKHPNIVSLLDADLTGEPPYYAMDILDGGSLERYVGLERRPPPGAAARWMEEICDALSYVHAKGLLHCDLKPANVLLDEEGRVRVADFGQSRILTETAGALGTLFFMAPEQAVVGEDSKDLHPDTRWDVFALGTTLYAVLTGRLPYESQRAKLEAAPTLRERLAAYQEAVRTVSLDWGEAGLSVGEDLVAIVNKCAAPDPAARYDSLSAVKADLRAMREKRPVSPLASKPGYRTRRFVQRNLPLVVLGAAAFVVLAWTGAQVIRARRDAIRRLAFSYAMRGRQFSEQGDDASAAAYYAEAYRLKPSSLAKSAARAHLRQLPVPRRIFPHKWGVRSAAIARDGKTVLTSSWEKGAFLWDADAPRPERRVLGHDSPVAAVDLSPDGRLALTAGKDGRVRLWEVATGQPAGELSGHAGGATIARFSPDASKILTADDGGTVRLWDVATMGRMGADMVHEVELGLPAEISAASFSPDGSRVVTGASDPTLEAGGALRVWQAGGNGAFVALGKRNEITAALFSPDGRRLASLDKAGVVWIWDLAIPPPKVKGIGLPVKSAACFAFSPDGARIVTGSADGEARAWGSEDGLAAGPPLPSPSPVRAVAFTPDGRSVLVAGDDGMARLWDPAGGQPAGPPLRHSGAVYALAFGAQGRALLTTAGDGAARLWELSPPAPTAPTPRAPSSPGSAAQVGAADPAWTLSLNQKVLAALPRDLVSMDFDNVDIRDVFSLMEQRMGLSLKFYSDVAGTMSLCLKDFPLNEAFGLILSRGRLRVEKAGEKALRISPIDGVDKPGVPGQAHRGASAPSQGLPSGFRLLGGQAPAAAAPGKQERGASTVVFSPDSARLLSLQKAGVVRLWDIASGAPTGAPLEHSGVAQTAFSPDGALVMTASVDGKVRLWDTLTGRAGAYRQGGEVLAAAFSPDGKRLLIGEANGGASLRSVDSQASVWLKQGAAVTALAFSPDGRFIATGGADGSVRLWTGAGKPVGLLAGLRDCISALSFDPAGQRLLAGSWDNTARVWDIPRCQRELLASKQTLLGLFLSLFAKQDPGDDEEVVEVKAKEPECEPAGPSFRHEGEVSAAAFDPSGQRFATADWSGTALVWDAAKGEPMGASLRHGSGIASLAFSPDGQTVLSAGWDGTARLWDVETGEPVWRPVSIGTPVTKVAFSPDGFWAAASGADGLVRLWPVGDSVEAASERHLALRSQVSGQKRINEKGDVETIPAEDLPALRERLSALEKR